MHQPHNDTGKVIVYMCGVELLGYADDVPDCCQGCRNLKTTIRHDTSYAGPCFQRQIARNPRA